MSLDAVVYINLKHRTDRRDDTEKQFASHLPQLERFEAVRELPGELGCTKSVIANLERALKEGWELFLLLEDDLVWNDDDAPSRLQAQILETVEQGGDGAVLTTFHGNEYRSSAIGSSIFHRVLYATDTGATLFTKSGAREMLRVQKNALKSYQAAIRKSGLSTSTSRRTIHLTTDRVREKVFKSQLWLAPCKESDMVVRQPGGYSDLGHAVIALDNIRDRERTRE